MSLAVALIIVTGCKKDGGGVLGGTQSPMGEVGTTFTAYLYGSVSGVGDITAEVVELEGGISDLDISIPITNPDLTLIVEALASIFPATVEFKDGVLKAQAKFKFTNEGIADVDINGKEYVRIKYNAKVGDEYRIKIGNNVAKHKVVSRSETDDFSWAGGFNIKVIKVEATGQNLPGLKKVDYYYNHRFGFVGATMHFSDGTSMAADFESSVDNF